MNTYFSDRIRNTIFLVFLTLTILVTIIACSVAAGQDRLFLTGYNQYLQVHQLINQDKYTEAEPIIADLVKKQSGTYQLLWMYGLCLAENGKPADGLKYMQKAREIRPALVINQSYLVQYGETLYNMRDYAEAKRYLLESKKYQKDNIYTQKADQLLQQIN